MEMEVLWNYHPPLQQAVFHLEEQLQDLEHPHQNLDLLRHGKLHQVVLNGRHRPLQLRVPQEVHQNVEVGAFHYLQVVMQLEVEFHVVVFQCQVLGQRREEVLPTRT